MYLSDTSCNLMYKLGLVKGGAEWLDVGCLILDIVRAYMSVMFAS